MFSILVADDEKVIRKGIISILKRELEEDVVFYEADNGLTALEICKKNTPQLTITDIRMPYCDGLEFVQKLRQYQRTAEIIILTGYEDFSYAQRAISLGVKEYILKPINKPEFLASIKKRIEVIVAEQEHQKLETAQGVVNQTIARQLHWNLLKELIVTEQSDEAAVLLAKLKETGISFDFPLCQCCVFDYCVSNQNRDYIDIAVQNIADEILSSQPDSSLGILCVPFESGRLVCVFSGSDTGFLKKQVKVIAAKAGFAIQKAMNILLYIGIGEIVHSPSKIQVSYRQAHLVAIYKMYKNKPFIREFEMIPKSTAGLEALGPLPEMGRMDIEKQHKIFSDYRKYEPSQELFYKLDDQYTKFLQRAGEQNTLPPIHQLWSFTQLQQGIDFVRSAEELNREQQEDNTNTKLLANVIAYVKENATKDINLNIVAAHFNKTAGYISTLFKKATGNGFNDYITNQRVEIAKGLLATSTIPVYQIAGLCGYPNAKYFSVVFKKATGETPAEFRNNFD